MPKTNVKTIIFDLGNVLYDIDIPLGFNAVHALINPEFDFVNWQRVFSPILFKYETGELSTEDFIDFILEYAKPAVKKQDVKHAWNSMLLEMPLSRIEILKSISERFQLFLLSNINDLHHNYFKNSLPNEFDGAAFESLFTYCYYSHLIGFRKPDSNAFQLVIKENKLDPSKTIFVDDIIENINTAKEIGLQTLHIDPSIVEDQIKDMFKIA